MSLVLRSDFPLPIRLHQRVSNDSLDRFVNDMFSDFLSPNFRQEQSVSTPKVNVLETEKAFELEAELPGVRKEDIKVSVDERLVSIEADVKGGTEKKDGENVIYAERTARKFVRSVKLSLEVDESRVEAKLENGILLLTLPKKEEKQAKQITVQ